MYKDNAKELVSFLEQRVGGSLRAVAFYSSDTIELLHLRDDLDRERIRRSVEPGLEILRQESQLEGIGALPFEDLNATVHLFGQGVLLHFPQGVDHGTVVTLDSGVARQLNGFVKECAAYLK
ncbi:hypothetical protein [Haladaptatus sp. YSMS36]|nr:hypothetical protein [Haladaptatus sp. YSMS36]